MVSNKINKMKIEQAISILKINQQWRKGSNIEIIDPKVTEAIDFLLNYISNETYESKGSNECHFEQATYTSSATICRFCGREKFLHKQ